MNSKLGLQTLWIKLDALQIRERLMIFGVGLMLVLAATEAWVLAPAKKRAQQAQHELRQQQTTLERLQAEAALLSSPGAAADSPRAQLASVNAQIDVIEQEIRALMPQARDASTLRRVLEAFLQRQEGLSLVRTNTLSADAPPLFAGGQATNASNPAERRGLELTIAGPYLTLARYVEGLERAMPDLRWGAMVMSQHEGITQLTLQVYVVGGAP